MKRRTLDNGYRINQDSRVTKDAVLRINSVYSTSGKLIECYIIGNTSKESNIHFTKLVNKYLDE